MGLQLVGGTQVAVGSHRLRTVGESRAGDVAAHRIVVDPAAVVPLGAPGVEHAGLRPHPGGVDLVGLDEQLRSQARAVKVRAGRDSTPVARAPPAASQAGSPPSRTATRSWPSQRSMSHRREAAMSPPSAS